MLSHSRGVQRETYRGEFMPKKPWTPCGVVSEEVKMKVSFEKRQAGANKLSKATTKTKCLKGISLNFILLKKF